MVPIRVALEGFMSYRERAELNFDGAPLWMLSGPNGAGKSSVFDAITFALYGLHRGGKNEAKELINHDCDSMNVEFDFALGAQLFRVRRTLSRRGRSGVQAYKLENSQSHAIAETELKGGFDSWIENTLGLDDRTFTTSVLLQQGRSDALLSEKAPERHKILSQIVDLGAYETLHKNVADRVRYLKTEAEILNNQLEGIERVEESEIERLAREAQDARQQVQVLATGLQQFAIAQNVCEQFHHKSREWQQTQQQLTQAQNLLSNAAQIEQAHGRWNELKIALPHLSRVVKLRGDQLANAQLIAGAQSEAQTWTQKLETATEQETLARETAQNWQTQREEWQEKREVAREIQLHLTSAVCELDDLERERETLKTLDFALKKFPDDLQQQLQNLREREAQTGEWKRALPWLRQIVNAREDWATMKAQNATFRAQSDEFAAQIEIHSQQLPALQSEVQNAQNQFQNAQELWTQSRTLLNEERKRLAKLAEVDGLAECETCGHELTPQHIAQERARREEAISVLASTCSEHKTQVQRWQNAQATAQENLQQVQNEIARLQSEKSQRDSHLNALKSDARAAQNSLQNAIENLPHEFAQRFESDVKATEHFKNPFPDANEIGRLEDGTRHHAQTVHKRELLEKDEREQEKVLAQRLSPLHETKRLEAKYSPQNAAKLREEFQAARGTINLSESRLRDIEADLRSANEEVKRWESAVKSARSGLDGTRETLSRETARRGSLQDSLDDAMQQLEGEWRIVAEHAHSDDVSNWQGEFAQLENAPSQMRQLAGARSDHATLIARAEALQNDLNAMPQAARGSLESIQLQIQNAQAQRAHWEAIEEECRGEKQALQARAQQRSELDARHRRATKDANTHKTLSELLGPQRLQRFLLQQAEDAIVNNANYWLDRISGGTLQIELKREDPNLSTDKTPKALELMARNTLTSEQSMPVYLLSGSQKFRVAVSLALGIGQFAGGESAQAHSDAPGNLRRIESVIIDEGFGSLDANGRSEMIEELHNLKSVLKRVILVSHQEEFSDAFPNRYHIEIKNGSSTAQIVTGA